VVPGFDWTAIDPPQGPLNIDSIVTLDEGVALLSGVASPGVQLWWRDTSGWESQLLEYSPTQLSRAGNDLIAYRARSGTLLTMENGRWVPMLDVEFPAATRSRQASGRASVLGAADGLLELSLFGDVWWIDSNGEPTLVVEEPSWGHGFEQPFTPSCRPPSRSSPDVPPIVATDDLIIAMTSSNPDEPFGIWPVCEPVSWTSTDGMKWSMATTNLSGDGIYVYDLAWRDGTLLAVGGRGIGRPAVWASGDGLEWVEVTPDMPEAVDLFQVEAGAVGWVMLGRVSLEPMPVGWTSTDATCWEPLPNPIGGSEAAVTDNDILIIDRTAPNMWLGSPTGSRGACR
jgi:hypothetical protein